MAEEGTTRGYDPNRQVGARAELELEHMIGFSTHSGGDGSVQFHPRDPDVIVSHIGCLLIIGNIKDPHGQIFLHGHTEEITCLAISPSGNLIASGQASSVREPNSEALVIVWDYATRRQIYSLGQLHDGIAFSRRAPRRPAAPSRQRGRPVARAPARPAPTAPARQTAGTA